MKLLACNEFARCYIILITDFFSYNLTVSVKII